MDYIITRFRYYFSWCNSHPIVYIIIAVLLIVAMVLSGGRNDRDGLPWVGLLIAGAIFFYGIYHMTGMSFSFF